MNENPKVPAGLKKCKKCGHYKGKCMFDDEEWIISCICKRQLCRRCGTSVYKYRITSNIYNEKAGKCWHVPICAAWIHKCPDGFKGQLEHSACIDIKIGEDLLHSNLNN